MTTDEAIDFLRTRTPLPSDADLSDELIGQYDEVRKHLQAHPDARAIPLLLNSFGQGSGFGVYQLVEDVLREFPRDEVIPHIVEALKSQRSPVRMWASQIASRFPDASLLTPLTERLGDTDAEVRSAAADALASIGDSSVIPALNEARAQEQDEDVRRAVDEAIGDLSSGR